MVWQTLVKKLLGHGWETGYQTVAAAIQVGTPRFAAELTVLGVVGGGGGGNPPPLQSQQDPCEVPRFCC